MTNDHWYFIQRTRQAEWEAKENMVNTHEQVTHLLNGWNKLIEQAEAGKVDLETVHDGAVMCLNTLDTPVRQLMENDKRFTEFINEVWGALYGKESKTEWEYPAQVIRHLQDELRNLREARS